MRRPGRLEASTKRPPILQQQLTGIAMHGLRFIVAAGCLLLTCAGCAVPSSQVAGCNANEADIVCTDLGAIRGTLDGPAQGFKGIPYAQPPVGPLRWRPPAPALAWKGLRSGAQYGADCPQIVGSSVQGDEDCLFLNVWRPLQKPTQPLPVMVWLTGGGNHAYSGAGSSGFGKVVYNGQALVPKNVIVVTYNLRLGVLGFLAHPALDAERAEKISGNYGNLDQIAMLQWVHRNIAAFGGDPGRVFLFGTSAGGGNICALMTSPMANGLFHGASMQSSVPAGCEIQTLADAENGTGRAVASKLGCDTSADVAACLRGKNTAEMVSAIPGTFTVFPRVYGPNMDGHVFPDQPIARIRQRQYSAMPVIIGNTSLETMQFVNAAGPVTDAASYGAAVAKVFGAGMRERVVARYPVSNYPTPRAAFVQLTTDALFTCESRRVARTLASVQQAPVYRYVFDHVLENDPVQKALGAIHTVEHPFLFNWQGTYQPTATDREVQRVMLGYWSRMASTGNPEEPDTPPWPPAGNSGDAYLKIGAATQGMSGRPEAQCDFWDTVPLPSPHI
jgi:para-nitrobenzyl esterase